MILRVFYHPAYQSTKKPITHCPVRNWQRKKRQHGTEKHLAGSTVHYNTSILRPEHPGTPPPENP
ncbi:MAG: hypothetical protein ACTSWP_04105 [Candidatus Freyarchaeota archaeon]|nr:hypothetical protein [Candidatus Freyrarchaeum guaymaensis]